MKASVPKLNFGVFLDGVLILFTYSLAHIPAAWVPRVFLLCFAAAAPLQALALCNMEMLPADFKPGWLRVLEVLVLILGVGGFVWLFVPALVLDSGLGWKIMRVAFFVALFGGVAAVGLVDPMGDQRPAWLDAAVGRSVLRAGAVLYLCVSEFLLYQSAHYYRGNVALGVIVISVFMSYVPVRWLMVKKRPFCWIEVASSIAAFAWFMSKLLRP